VPDSPPLNVSNTPPGAAQFPIRTVPALPDVPNPAAVAQAPYTEYAITPQLVWNYGLVAQPVAGPPGTPCKVVRLHAPFCTKVVTWVARRVGAKPVCPSPDTGSADEVLIGKSISPPAPGTLVDGSQVWTVQGTYWYALQVPPSETDPLMAGATPADGGGPTANVLYPSDFSRNLIAPVPGVSGSVPPAVNY
jgi:hypothetical protein